MIFRFQYLRFGTLGILLLCVGFAILGTGVADYFIRSRENAWRRQFVSRPPVIPEKLFPDYNVEGMKLVMMRASIVSIGSPLVVHLTALEMPPHFIIGTKPLPVGSPAPDFTLRNAMDGREVHLADYCNKKPVILLFGSFGCDVFCRQLAGLNKLYLAYKDRAEFFFVYITEAPHKGLLPPPHPAEPFLGRIPRGLRHFKIPIPCLVGNQAIEAAYTPFPERLLIVDRSGRIALDGGLGIPKGWDLDQVESWLKQI